MILHKRVSDVVGHEEPSLGCYLDVSVCWIWRQMEEARPRAVMKSYLEEFLERTAGMEQKGDEFEQQPTEN